VSLAELIWTGLFLLGAYGLGRYIRYQRWSPEPKGKWEMEYERDSGTWDIRAKRSFPEFEYKSGMALTYRAAVRRSRRMAYLADRKVKIVYGPPK